MEGTNHMLLNAESVRIALEDYLNKHAVHGVKFEVGSWGMHQFDGREWCDVEFTQLSAPAAGGE